MIVTVLQYIGPGVLGLIGFLVLAVLLFGKRIEKQWEVRADFYAPGTRHRIGKFEVEKQRIAGEETEFKLQSKCNLRHPALRAGLSVRVTVGETVAMEGTVKQDGRLRLRNDAWTGNIAAPGPGATVTVRIGNEALASAELYSD